MDCGYFEKIIYRLPDDDLSPAEREELAAHITDCDSCRALYDAMGTAREGLTERVAVPEDFAAKVMKGVRAEEKAMKAEAAANARKAKAKRHWRLGDLGLIAACMAMVVVVLNVVYGDLGRRDTAAEAAPMMLEEAIEEAAPETAEAAYGVAEATAMDGAANTGAADTAAMARNAANEANASANAEVYAADGSYLGTLASEVVDMLLITSDDTVETDAVPDWTLQLYGANYELFSVDGSVYWRETGSDSLTRSAMSADDFTAAIE